MNVKINEEMRVAIRLAHQDGLSYRDIADMFSVSHQTVKNVIISQNNQADDQNNSHDEPNVNQAQVVASEEERIQRIEDEKLRLWDLLNELDENTLNSLIPLVDNLAFLRMQMDELKEYIIKHGIKEKYQIGKNQFGYKESSEAKMLNVFLQRYTQINAQLISLLPKEVAVEVSDGFDEMLANKPQ